MSATPRRKFTLDSAALLVPELVEACEQAEHLIQNGGTVLIRGLAWHGLQRVLRKCRATLDAA